MKLNFKNGLEQWKNEESSTLPHEFKIEHTLNVFSLTGKWTYQYTSHSSAEGGYSLLSSTLPMYTCA